MVRIGTFRCADDPIPGGEGRPADTAIATHELRAVLRNPLDALSVFGVGGGTLVDAASWDGSDGLIEAIPVVGGGWLDVDAFTVADDRVTVGGTVVALPGLPPPAALGERREIAWIPDPDGPWLRADGADALLVHATGDETLLGDALWGPAVYSSDSGALTDLGGAVLFDGNALLVASSSDGTVARPDSNISVSGRAPGAERIALWSADVPVGVVAVTEGTFATAVPASVDRIRAEADGHAPGAWSPPGDGLELAVGAAGSLDLTDEGVPFALDWSDDAGRTGSLAIGRGDVRVPLGAGTYHLTARAGPAAAAWAGDVAIPADAVVPVRVALHPRFDPGSRVLLRLPWPSSASVDRRVSDDQAVIDAIAAGAEAIVLAPTGEVGTPPIHLPPFVQVFGGSLLASDDGYTIVGWPFNADARHAGHGAVDPHGLSARDAFYAVQRGAVTNRKTVVDLAWMRAIDLAPYAVDPPPDAVRLDAPTDPTVDWAPWFAWLDAGRAVAPVGPATWVSIGDRDLWGPADVERGLLLGAVVAGTGGLIELTVDGTAPGAVAPPIRGSAKIRTSISGGPFTHAIAVGEGGRVLARLAPTGTSEALISDPGDYIVVIAWSDAGAWAATGPVWIATR